VAADGDGRAVVVLNCVVQRAPLRAAPDPQWAAARRIALQ
jgi:hypothetical protein